MATTINHQPKSLSITRNPYHSLPPDLTNRRQSPACDARVIMGDDENALLRLWREKCGEVEPEDLSGNLLVQLGVTNEPINFWAGGRARAGT
jgi:hypothetical protein